MALRGTLTHRKIRTLARLLEISPCFALGIVESLWHVTAEQAPAGNIGRMTDEDLAMEMFYEADAKNLVLALIGAKLLDTNPAHRLIVHDWHLHADDATDNKIARQKERYASGEVPRMKRLSKNERDHLIAQYATPCAQNPTDSHEEPLPVPVPDPEPVPEPEPVILAPSPAEPIAGTPFLDMPTNRAGEAFTVTEELLDEWGPLYPAVDVRQQVRNMRGWLDGNPERRKTRKGMTRFIHNWLGDKQNKAGANGASKDNSGSNGTRGAAVGRVERGQSAFRQAALASVEAAGGFDAGPDDGSLPFAGASPGHGEDVPARSGDASGGVRDNSSGNGAGVVSHAPEILPPSQRNPGGSGSHGSQRAH